MGADLNDGRFGRVGKVRDGNLVVRDIAQRVGFHLCIFQVDVQVTLGLLAFLMNYNILHVALLPDTGNRLIIVWKGHLVSPTHSFPAPQKIPISIYIRGLNPVRKKNGFPNLSGWYGREKATLYLWKAGSWGYECVKDGSCFLDGFGIHCQELLMRAAHTVWNHLTFALSVNPRSKGLLLRVDKIPVLPKSVVDFTFDVIFWCLLSKCLLDWRTWLQSWLWWNYVLYNLWASSLTAARAWRARHQATLVGPTFVQDVVAFGKVGHCFYLGDLSGLGMSQLVC